VHIGGSVRHAHNGTFIEFGDVSFRLDCCCWGSEKWKV